MHETGLVHLWAFRHAKSSWDRPGLDDRDRPLSRRGVRAAARMREFFDAEEIRPELVVCSSALRARETLAGILPALGPESWTPSFRRSRRLAQARELQTSRDLGEPVPNSWDFIPAAVKESL